MQGPTKYNQEVVDQYWKQAGEVADAFKTGIAALAPKWADATTKCQGIPAIVTAKGMVDKMQQMSVTLSEAVQTGTADNHNYQKEMEAQVVGQDIHLD